MFLATTAISEFWDTEKELAFLSVGCLRYNERPKWEGLHYLVLPNPWDDRERFSKADLYLDASYERLLAHLGKYLNSAHGISYGPRYWRVLLGPWLLHYTQGLYDRYVQITEALETYPQLETEVLDPNWFETPRDALEYVDWACDDKFNLQLYSQILLAKGYAFPSKGLSETWIRDDHKSKNGINDWLRSIKRAVNQGITFAERFFFRIFNRNVQVALCDMYLTRSQMWSLIRRTGFKAVPVDIRTNWPFPILGPIFDERRNNLGKITAEDEFESLLVQTLPQNFPTNYLEGFERARSHTLTTFRKLPRVAASLVGWYFNEPFKFMASEVAENGGRLISAQHGGAYGTRLFSPTERHETRLADTYLVWGWGDENQRPHKNIPSPMLQTDLQVIKSDSHPVNNSILLVTTAQPRFLHLFHTFPVGGQNEEYLEWQMRFLSAIPNNIRDHLKVRPFVVDHGWDVQQRIADRFENLNWSIGGSFQKRAMASRIVVHDHAITTFLETMAANIPTIGFWDPKRWEMRKEAQPHFQSLRKAGIVWDTPEDAASKVAEIFEQPLAWWSSRTVQNARREFVERYAMASADWAEVWAKTLLEEVSQSQMLN